MSDFKVKWTKFDFGWGSAPDPAGEAYSALQTHLAGFKGAYFYGKGGKWEGGRGREREEKGKGRRKGREWWEEREGEGKCEGWEGEGFGTNRTLIITIYKVKSNCYFWKKEANREQSKNKIKLLRPSSFAFMVKVKVKLHRNVITFGGALTSWAGPTTISDQ